jgi:hypothetical protein
MAKKFMAGCDGTHELGYAKAWVTSFDVNDRTYLDYGKS